MEKLLPCVSVLCRYSSLVTGHRAKAIIALCWLLSVVIGLTPMMGWNRGRLMKNGDVES